MRFERLPNLLDNLSTPTTKVEIMQVKEQQRERRENKMPKHVKKRAEKKRTSRVKK